MTILQSWSQGVEVWGESGMKKLWSAANIKVYGGGVSEATFLEDLSRMIGDYDRQSSSLSTGRGHRTVSQQLHRERILDVADLAAMPKGRAVVLASGSRPTLIQTQPWMTGPHAAGVRASIAAHDPQAPRTISQAEREVALAGDRRRRDGGAVSASLGEWDATPAGHDSQSRAEGEPPRLFYGSVDEFVRDHLRYVYRRRVGDRAPGRWAAQWWRYEEAIERLEALWRAWEHLRQEPTLGMSVWWRDHADPHMAALLDPDGPFAGVEGEENVNKRGEPLPYKAPPAGLFPDVRQVPAVSVRPSQTAPESP